MKNPQFFNLIVKLCLKIFLSEKTKVNLTKMKNGDRRSSMEIRRKSTDLQLYTKNSDFKFQVKLDKQR